MCLAVPGRILALLPTGPRAVAPSATVDFAGASTEVSLALTPRAQVGDWVLVHAGMALQVVDAAEARETWAVLREAGIMPEAGHGG